MNYSHKKSARDLHQKKSDLCLTQGEALFIVTLPMALYIDLHIGWARSQPLPGLGSRPQQNSRPSYQTALKKYHANLVLLPVRQLLWGKRSLY